jgi:uncharacterized protein YutD
MIKIKDNNYEIQTNYRDAFDLDVLLEKVTDYFVDFDYIVGDWAYGKLRLKGFNNKENKNFNKINDISNLDDYILNECAYGCKYFVLKKINS